LYKKAKVSIFYELIIKFLTKICLMICFDKITELYCITDEFCKNFEKTTQSFIIGNKPKKKPRMNTSEVITIYYLFHLGVSDVSNIFIYFTYKNT
jgi:hypothetical protein